MIQLGLAVHFSPGGKVARSLPDIRRIVGDAIDLTEFNFTKGDFSGKQGWHFMPLPVYAMV